MTTYLVSANNIDLGVYDADSEQEARDLAAQDVGYKSEVGMVEQLEQLGRLFELFVREIELRRN